MAAIGPAIARSDGPPTLSSNKNAIATPRLGPDRARVRPENDAVEELT